MRYQQHQGKTVRSPVRTGAESDRVARADAHVEHARDAGRVVEEG
jgi:hypothetical protein